MLLTLLALLACEAPRFAHLSESLQRYDAGRAALDAGDAEGAVRELQAAVAANPASAELWLWLGSAQARAGRAEEAMASATEALARRPRWSLALYNRACWSLRGGSASEAELQRAAEDLRLALSSGELNPLEVAVDPDLAPLRAHPELSAVLPPAHLPLEVEASAEPVFLGSEWELHVQLRHAAGAPPALLLGEASTLPARPVAALETWDPGKPLGTRGLTLRLEVLGPGEGALGGWRVDAGGLTGEAAPTRYHFLAPEGAAPVAALPVAQAFTWPSKRLEGLSAPGVRRDGELVVVRGEPGDRVEWGSGVEDPMRLELREDGAIKLVGWQARLPLGEPVRVLRGGRLLLEARP
ncbi:MAG: tetratricopeptide repeat protein [Alphaproteobacteria bacterium]|nr:tetratricopeptide repeat protein [Alphaproteobacteria bacterium]